MVKVITSSVIIRHYDFHYEYHCGQPQILISQRKGVFFEIHEFRGSSAQE